VNIAKNETLTLPKRIVYIEVVKHETPIERAIRLAGGTAALARLLGESMQTVSNWRARGEAPANRCPAIEMHTGVSRRELRADWQDYWPELQSDFSSPKPIEA
jgi:DNA-binding transcriptional regulator YdaS (Cro superfamily)